MTRALLLCLLASPVAAQDVRTWPGYGGMKDSTARLHAPTVEEADATLTFRNTTVHSGDETFTLTWGDISVEVRFDWQADGHAERLMLLPPPGYIARPDVLTVDEDDTGVAHIIKYRGG